MRRRGGRRPLTLHVSALSNAEYDAYTASLAEVTGRDDVEWEALSIGVREARGWLKGRYGVDGAVMDQILRLFCPVLGAQDVLSAGQFFAALRLLSHVQNGASLDEQLVFLQANPERERTPSPNKHPPPLPPRTPPVTNHGARAPVPPNPNPFRRSSVPAPPRPPPHSASSSSSSSSSAAAAPTTLTSPPLPPRKPPLPPPRHGSLAHPMPSTSTTPHTPSRLPLPHTTSPLIKHGLHAAQSTKDAHAALKNVRRLQVIKSSSPVHTGGGTPEKAAPRPPSPPASLYDVAHARVARTQSLHNPLTTLPKTDSPPSSPAPSPAHNPPLARHVSLTRADLDRARVRAESLRASPSPRSGTFEGLRPSTAAAFESLRAKAEGRVWPGGYVKDAPLVSNRRRGEGAGQEGEGDRAYTRGAFGFGQDVDGAVSDDDDDYEADNRVREGWRPL